MNHHHHHIEVHRPSGVTVKSFPIRIYEGVKGRGDTTRNGLIDKAVVEDEELRFALGTMTSL